MGMHKHVQLKANYLLRVHQFTIQQADKWGKRRNDFSLITKSNFQYVQTCSFKANLPAKSAPVHNTARVKKEWIFTHHKFQAWVCTKTFIERKPTVWETTSSQHHKWVKEVKKGMNFHSSHKIQSWVCTNIFIQRNLPSESVHQFTTQQVGKGGKKGMTFTQHTKSNEYAQTCSLIGSLPSESAPVHNIASGKGDRRNEISLNTQNPMVSMHKHLRW